MTATESVIATARRIAIEETGDDRDAVVIEVLARLVVQSTHGATSGFLRLPRSLEE